MFSSIPNFPFVKIRTSFNLIKNENMIEEICQLQFEHFANHVQRATQSELLMYSNDIYIVNTNIQIYDMSVKTGKEKQGEVRDWKKEIGRGEAPIVCFLYPRRKTR